MTNAESAAKWRRLHPEKARARNQRCTRNYLLKKNFGLTRQQYEDLKIAQGNRCAICGCTSEQNGKELAVDHVHGSDPIVVRGLICDRCNRALGLLRDDPVLCENAGKYLRGGLKMGFGEIDWKKMALTDSVGTMYYNLGNGIYESAGDGRKLCLTYDLEPQDFVQRSQPGDSPETMRMPLEIAFPKSS